MWARLDEHDYVEELLDFDPTGRFHPSLRFVPVPDGWEKYVDHTYGWDGQSLIEPEPGTLVGRARADRKADAAAKRREAEAGGLRLPQEMGGVRVNTAIDDQNRIATAIQGMRDSGLSEIDFKADSGWVRLTLEQLVAVSRLVTAHVQACFAAERAHHAALDALNDFDGLRAYDVGTGWPDEDDGPAAPAGPEGGGAA